MKIERITRWAVETRYLKTSRILRKTHVPFEQSFYRNHLISTLCSERMEPIMKLWQRNCMLREIGRGGFLFVNFLTLWAEFAWIISLFSFTPFFHHRATQRIREISRRIPDVSTFQWSPCHQRTRKQRDGSKFSTSDELKMMKRLNHILYQFSARKCLHSFTFATRRKPLNAEILGTCSTWSQLARLDLKSSC